MYVDNMVAEAQKQKKRKPIIPGWLKAVMGIAAIIVCCVLPFFALEFVIGYFGEGTRPIPGDASNFDPIAVYPEVSKFAGENVRLQSIRIYYVRSDGTIDLGASYRPYVEYSFYRQLAAPPANAPPIGAGGSPNQTWYETITVNVSSPRSYHVRSGNSEYDYYNFGMQRKVRDPTSSPQTWITDPTCTLRRLWSAAIENHAPKEAVARIEYTENGYSFEISDINVRMKFDTDCHITESNQKSQ